MLKFVTVTNHNGESLRMELSNPTPSGLAIESIDGLGPAKATIFNTTLVTKDGSIVSGSRCDNRSIVLHLIMWQDGERDIEACRQLTYRYFPIKHKIKLSFETDHILSSFTPRIREIEGYVESSEPDIFSDMERTAITVLCPDPWFKDPENQAFFYTGVTNLFEFPFSNECVFYGDPPAPLPFNENLISGWDVRPAAYEFYQWGYGTAVWGNWQVSEEDATHISIFNSEYGITFQNNDLREMSDFVYKMTPEDIGKLNASIGQQTIISLLTTNGLNVGIPFTLEAEAYGEYGANPGEMNCYILLNWVGPAEAYMVVRFKPECRDTVIAIKMENGTEQTLARPMGNSWEIAKPDDREFVSGWQVVNTLEMSSRSLATAIDIESDSDIDVGVEARIDFLAGGSGIGDIVLYNRRMNQRFMINIQRVIAIVGSIEIGDYILVNTRPGSKRVSYYRAGVFYRNIIGAINRDNDWFGLTIGLNQLAYSATAGEENLQVTFYYYNAYGGV